MAFGLKRILKKSYLVRFASWLGLFNFVDLLAMFLPTELLVKTRKRVVFIKMDGIGDYIIWTANFETIKEMYPADEFELVMVGNDRWKGLAENETSFEQKIFVNSERLIGSPVYRFRVMREIRSLAADIVINPRLTRDFLWGDSMVRCSAAPLKIGSSGLDNLMTKAQERISERWYTKLISAPPPDEHELVSNLIFLNAIDPSFDPELKAPILPTRVKVGDLDLSDKYAIFFLSAFSADRRWPVERFAETAEFVSTKYGFQIVVCGGPGDVSLAGNFGLCFSGPFVNLIGKTTLPELSDLIGPAQIVVTNDTGASHISIAAKCPTVVIMPGNQVGRYFPYPSALEKQGVRHLPVLHEMPCFGCGYFCIYTDLPEDAPKPCVANVPVNDVTDAIIRLMGDEPLHEHIVVSG